LPNRYKAKRARVIDYKGNLSDHIDIVIYDAQYSLFVFNQNENIYIPAESVYAIFEVKQNLNKAHIEYTAQKIASVRRLERSSAPIYYSDGPHSAKALFTIIGGIICLSNDWKGLDQAFYSAIKSCSEQQQLNLGCCIEVGSFVFSYEKGEIVCNKSTKENALIFFFLNLIEMLQKLGTVPAIEISKYRQGIASSSHKIE